MRPAAPHRRLDASEIVADLPSLVPAAKAARFLSLTTRTLARWRSAGRIRFVKLPGRCGLVRYPRAELQRIVEESLR
jgi:predicted site-specific integrase-resolvase